MGVDSVKHDFPVIDVVPEMVELDVDVLGAWVHLRDFCILEGTAVVFKDLAVDGRLSGDHVKTLAL